MHLQGHETKTPLEMRMWADFFCNFWGALQRNMSSVSVIWNGVRQGCGVWRWGVHLYDNEVEGRVVMMDADLFKVTKPDQSVGDVRREI